MKKKITDAGVTTLQRILRAMQSSATSSERIPKMVRGGVYRSNFIRGLATSRTITDFVSRHFNVSCQPHSIPHQLAHVNYAPKEVGRAVDLW